MTDLEHLQEEIESVDKKIINLLNERFDLTYELNKIKDKENLPRKDIEYEWDVKDKLEQYSNYTNMIEYIWEAIFKYGNTLGD